VCARVLGRTQAHLSSKYEISKRVRFIVEACTYNTSRVHAFDGFVALECTRRQDTAPVESLNGTYTFERRADVENPYLARAGYVISRLFNSDRHTDRRRTIRCHCLPCHPPSSIRHFFFFFIRRKEEKHKTRGTFTSLYV